MKLIPKKQSNPTRNKKLDFLEVDNYKISEFILKKVVPILGIHPFPLNEVQLIVSSLCWANPEYVFDWGTHMGKSARIFYETKIYFNLKAQIISIDLPDNEKHQEHPGRSRGKLVKKFKEVKLLQGDGVTKAMEVCRARKVSKALFFLDGDHEYKSIKRELNTIHSNIDNPTILVHDTFFQSKKSGYNVGPHKAIKEFLTNNKKYKSITTSMGLPGMTLIY